MREPVVREGWFVGPRSTSALGQRPQDAGAQGGRTAGRQPPGAGREAGGSRRAHGRGHIKGRRQLLSRGVRACCEERSLVAVRRGCLRLLQMLQRGPDKDSGRRRRGRGRRAEPGCSRHRLTGLGALNCPSLVNMPQESGGGQCPLRPLLRQMIIC